jgi:cytochrome c peroxidase
MQKALFSALGVVFLAGIVSSASVTGSAPTPAQPDGERLFVKETFAGNGRTCRTCHSEDTGTVSPKDAEKRFQKDPADPLFLHDGSDDGLGHGISRMIDSATILMTLPLPPNVKLADDPTATTVVLRRGIPTTINTPALDPILMLDGRQPSLEAQAAGAIHDHAQSPLTPSTADLHAIAEFQRTKAFFSSPALRNFARGGPEPGLPQGVTPSEQRGRRFFEQVPPDPSDGFKPGLCGHCHGGPMMNKTNEFAPLFFGVPVATGTRFQDVLVSFFNDAGNPMREFIFNQGTPAEAHVFSPDPGRALITGVLDGPAFTPPGVPPTFENTDAFKISPLRGIRNTAPYFHDNSAKTLEDVAAHYARFFDFVTGGFITLSPQDQKDIVAFLKLLD